MRTDNANLRSDDPNDPKAIVGKAIEAAGGKDKLAKINAATAKLKIESVSAEEFVADAVREKLEWRERKVEFYRLSDETHRMMDEKGISEATVLGDFEAFRESLTRD